MYSNIRVSMWYRSYNGDYVSEYRCSGVLSCLRCWFRFLSLFMLLCFSMPLSLSVLLSLSILLYFFILPCLSELSCLSFLFGISLLLCREWCLLDCMNSLSFWYDEWPLKNEVQLSNPEEWIIKRGKLMRQMPLIQPYPVVYWRFSHLTQGNHIPYREGGVGYSRVQIQYLQSLSQYAQLLWGSFI